jgi:cytochrome P450
MSPLFQPAPIHHYAECMRLVAIRAANAMTPGTTLDLAHETTRIAMSVVGKALFDVDTFDEADALGGALTTCLRWVDRNLASPAVALHVLMLDLTEAATERTTGRAKSLAQRLHERAAAPFLLPGARDPELVAAARLLDDRMQAMIDERRASDLSRNDLMTRLLTALDADTGERMSDRQVRDEAITLFVAGHETTATALAWSFYLLARDPAAMARAQAEADAFGDEPITSWQPERLAYLTRVFREAMRLYPPLVMFARRSLEDVAIMDTHVPARTITIVSAYAQHHRARTYPDPQRFDPDRWLPEREALRHKSAYLPFGAGPRVCIGIHFAMMEGPIVLATLLRRHRFEVDPRRTIDPDDFATLRPKGGVPAVVRARA